MIYSEADNCSKYKAQNTPSRMTLTTWAQVPYASKTGTLTTSIIHYLYYPLSSLFYR